MQVVADGVALGSCSRGKLRWYSRAAMARTKAEQPTPGSHLEEPFDPPSSCSSRDFLQAKTVGREGHKFHLHAPFPPLETRATSPAAWKCQSSSGPGICVNHSSELLFPSPEVTLEWSFCSRGSSPFSLRRLADIIASSSTSRHWCPIL